MTIWRYLVCWISKATREQAHARALALTQIQKHARISPRARTRTHRHAKYAILTVFLRQQWCIPCLLLIFQRI